MKLKKLTLENFRCFSDLEINFHDRLTVIVGGNGVGKTTILDGVAILLGRFVTRLPGVSGIGTSPADIRIVSNGKICPAFRCSMEMDVSTELGVLGVRGTDVDGGTLVGWSLSRLRDKTPKTKLEAVKTLRSESIGWKQIDAFADRLVNADLESTPYQMPLIAYYGTNRAVFETPLRRRNFKTEFARFDSLAGALSPSANFKRVFEWIHAKENEEAREQKKLLSFEYEDVELAVVRRAITTFFPDFQNPRTEIRPLRFVVDRQKNGQTVTFDLNQLSDGYRTMLALVADLASRMAEANPPLIANMDPLHTEAVVLIDEVDLHLHPAWQQEVLPQIQGVFPKTQFVVTTHSPQVLTTVPPECIRELNWENDEVKIRVPDFSLGAESPVVLQTIQGVNPRPQSMPIVKKLNRYLELISLNKWDTDEAIRLRAELETWGHGYESSLTKADMDIRLRTARQKRS